MSLLEQAPIDEILKAAGPQVHGTVAATDGMSLRIGGLTGWVKLGDTVSVSTTAGRTVRAKIIAIDGELATAFAYESLAGVAGGDIAMLERNGDHIFPCDQWLGRIIDPFGNCLEGGSIRPGKHPYALDQQAPNAAKRKSLGARLATGHCVFDTLLPLCVGQRLGLFAGAGVGKSMLLGELAQRVDADVTIVALIGERGREVRSFVNDTLGADGMKKAVVIASTADQSPLAKKQGAYLAMAIAEYFRDQCKKVLLVFDSLTRFAESHREVAVSAGEPPSLHAFPPSTFRTIASLVERAGPGEEGSGDITSIFSVLVQGSDMNEPVADMIRGILDGHVVLERKIAERGRFPAVDISRSVSRSLPAAASEEENQLLMEARSVIRAYEGAETIVRAGLYADGADPLVDRALKLWPQLDGFLAAKQEAGTAESFERLRAILQDDDESAPA